MLKKGFIRSVEGVGHGLGRGVVGEALMADNISSLGLVAISSSSGVIRMVFAGGTAFKIVPRGFGLSLTGALFRLIHFFCFSVICLGIRTAA